MKYKIIHIIFFFLLLSGLTDNVFANDLVIEASKKSIEKRVVECESIMTWSAANFAKKAIISADIVGTGLAITGQLLSSNILSTEQKGFLQIGALIASTPLLLTSFPKINKLVDDFDILARNQSFTANQDMLLQANETNYEAAVSTNNANGNSLGPNIDPEEGRILAHIDDPSNGMANRMAENVPGQVAGYACLNGDTPIPTKDGYTLLTDIKENDEIITNGNQSTKVLTKIKNVVNTLVILTLCNGENIKASPDHIFYNDKQEYVISQNIIAGNKLLNKDGEAIEVCNITKKDTLVDVYDLITQDGGYSVGESALTTETCILRIIGENTNGIYTYPILRTNYKSLNKTKRAILVEDLYKAKLAGSEGPLLTVLNNPNGIKAWEGLINWEILRRNPVDLNTVSNYLTRTNRTITQFKDELFTDLPSIRIWLDNQAANIFKFTSKRIDDFVSFSTKQSSQSKVMLGKYDNGGPTGYIAKAGNNHSYFDMGNKWDEAKNLVTGGSNEWTDEMWEINKKFLQNQKNQGKEFWFSHDPFSPGNDQFFAREVNWLIDNGVQNFQQVGDLWKAVW